MNAPDAWGGVVGAWPQNRRNEIRQGTLTYVRARQGAAELRIRGRTPRRPVSSTAPGPRDPRRGGRAAGGDRGGLVVLPPAPTARRRSCCARGSARGGPARASGSSPLVDLPVGRRLGDHPQCFFELRSPPGLAAMAVPASPSWRAATAGGRSRSPSTRRRASAPSRSRWPPRSLRHGHARLRRPSAAPRIDHRYRDVIARGSSTTPSRRSASWSRRPPSRRGRRRGCRPSPRGDSRRAPRHCVPPGGTCAIGSVVDEARRPRRRGTHVADASVFPPT